MSTEDNKLWEFTDTSQVNDTFFEDLYLDEAEESKIYNANLFKLFKNMEKPKVPSIDKENITKTQINCQNINAYSLTYYNPLIIHNANRDLFYELGVYLNEINNHNQSVDEFVEYMNYKIKGDKKLKIPKDVVKYAYAVFQSYFYFPNLCRTEKRSKAKLYEKMHKVSKIIRFGYDKKPEIFLSPVILYMNTKKSKH